MKKYLLILITLLTISTAYSMHQELERAIKERDTQTVQTLVLQLHKESDQAERGALQTIGRGAIKALYQAACRAEQEAAGNAETRYNKHVAIGIVKTSCCAAGFTYHLVKFVINWYNYQNWTETALGVYLGGQGCYEFYQVLTNKDAKIEYAKAQLIRRNVQDLHNTIENTSTVLLDDLEKQ